MALTLIAHSHDNLVDSMIGGLKDDEHPDFDSFAAQTDCEHSVEQLTMAKVAVRCCSDWHPTDLRRRDLRSSLSKNSSRQI